MVWYQFVFLLTNKIPGLYIRSSQITSHRSFETNSQTICNVPQSIHSDIYIYSNSVKTKWTNALYSVYLRFSALLNIPIHKLRVKYIQRDTFVTSFHFCPFPFTKKYYTLKCVSMGSKRLLLLFQICVVSICALSKSSLAADVNDSVSKREVNCTAYYIEKALGVNKDSITVSVKCIFLHKTNTCFFPQFRILFPLFVCVCLKCKIYYLYWLTVLKLFAFDFNQKSVCLFFVPNSCVICRFFWCFNVNSHEFWSILIQLTEMVNKIIRFVVTFGRHQHIFIAWLDNDLITTNSKNRARLL